MNCASSLSESQPAGFEQKVDSPQLHRTFEGDDPNCIPGHCSHVVPCSNVSPSLYQEIEVFGDSQFQNSENVSPKEPNPPLSRKERRKRARMEISNLQARKESIRYLSRVRPHNFTTYETTRFDLSALAGMLDRNSPEYQSRYVYSENQDSMAKEHGGENSGPNRGPSSLLEQNVSTTTSPCRGGDIDQLYSEMFKNNQTDPDFLQQRQDLFVLHWTHATSEWSASMSQIFHSQDQVESQILELCLAVCLALEVDPEPKIVDQFSPSSFGWQRKIDQLMVTVQNHDTAGLEPYRVEISHDYLVGIPKYNDGDDLSRGSNDLGKRESWEFWVEAVSFYA
ncbi:hypothetical protein TWF481_002140 [Arthrobotrys musiformis]|uniref:BHLH domain-containing protein n=1 Tax=Arthrobotrys musiformis TaxID=47236 RepID=A0AAV9VV79_9PEZI